MHNNSEDEISLPSNIEESDLIDGTVQLGDYDITAVLGQGTFGKVYLAELEGDARQFAIKAIRKNKLIEKNAIDSTLQEF